MFVDFRESGREIERETNITVRETSIGCLPYTPLAGQKSACFKSPSQEILNQMGFGAIRSLVVI